MNTPPSSKEESILPQPLLNSLSSLSTNEILPSLRVFVRSPSDTLPNNFSVPVDQNSTVKDLKLFLATEHPQKPKPEDQRLIFCGKLLEEDTRIYDLLKKCDLSVSQTFHLVVRHASTDNLSTSNTSTPRIPASPTPPHPTPSSAPPLPPFHQNEPFTPFQHFTTSSPSEIVLNGIRYQHVRINGLPYLMSLPYPHYAGDPTLPISGDALPGRHVPNDPLQAAMRPARQGNGSSVQLAIKIAVLLLIFCRNASIERVVLMHIAALVIFLHQTGRLRVVRGRVLPNGDIALDRNEGQAVAGTGNNNNNPNNPNNDSNGGENGGSAVSAMLQGVWAFISSMVPSNEVEE